MGEAYSFDNLTSERLRFEGMEIPVVTPRALYEMKKDTVRERHRADAERLRERFGLGED